VPRAKFTKPPGPLPAIGQIHRSEFRFRDDQWRELAKLLPCKLVGLEVPPDAKARFPEKVKTIADCVIQATEEVVITYLTASVVISESPINAANNRAAIRRLREALRPFVCGWVDDETADIIDWRNLDAKLAARDREIAQLRLPPAKRRILAMLCQSIEVCVRQFVCANGATVGEQDMLRYVDTVLKFARIKHPNIAKHRDRLAKLVVPSEQLPH
jgi:hypothetical protein